jgi:hypothetical protein
VAPDKQPFVNVDELMTRVTVEQAALFYGVPLPELHRIGAETRTRCFLVCGKTKETGDRVLAIQEGDPARKWRCHQYGCGKGGNLVSLCDLLKPGPNQGGKPRGDRFREIARDLLAMAGGGTVGERPTVPSPPPAAKEPEPPKVNTPLCRSENERARALTELDVKFVRDIESMPPAASAYVRKRPYLSPEAMRDWRVGYLPRNAGGDQSGGTMRGKIVYGYHSADGNLLTWFGRDPEYEEKHARWELTDKSQREPAKFHFVAGFHRGIELFGQERLRGPETAERLQGLGLVLVEGPNDVIRLATLGVPAVALCSNTISREQAQKAAELAYSVAGGMVTVFLDCDAEGEKGMKQCLGYLAQLVPVRLGWTSGMHGGKFKGRQPESLTAEEWAAIAAFLRGGRSEGSRDAVVETTPLPPAEAERDEWDFV